MPASPERVRRAGTSRAQPAVAQSTHPHTWAITRSEPRLPSSRVPSITGLHLSPYGAQARLANISKRGILVRSDTRLSPETVITVIFEGSFSASPVSAQVVRSHVAEIDSTGKLWFEIAILFERPITLDGHVLPENAVPAPSASEPAGLPGPQLSNRW